MEKNIDHMRQNYTKDTLSKSDLAVSPLAQFALWFEQAKEDISVREANAMYLSTVDDAGQPQGRIVLLKAFDDQGFVFFTRYSSAKGAAIAKNNRVALTFFWPELERQVRINGLAEKVSAQASDDYFYSRPTGSQVGAIASPQSQVIENYAVLEDAAAGIEQSGKIQRPADWGGYSVIPDYFEFWQGRPNRLHDRFCYTKQTEGWLISRLAP